MMNQDFILRIAEQFGRELSILIGLRERKQYEEELIALDDLLLKQVGLTSRFINALSEEMLLQLLSPIGQLNVESSLWIAGLLMEEGTVYESLGNTTESYYRYLKSLYLLLEIAYQEQIHHASFVTTAIKELMAKLNAYTLSAPVQRSIVRYYDQLGMYAQAENVLFESLEQHPEKATLEQGYAFYQRLLKKSDMDLQAGNLSLEEVQEGLAQLQQFSI